MNQKNSIGKYLYFALVWAGILLCFAGCGTDRALVLTRSDSEAVAEESAEAETAALLLDTSESDSAEAVAEAEEAQAQVSSEPLGTVCVYVCGEVENPGLYELPANSRIGDALALAGGMKDTASQTAVNLAAFVTDGEMIYFPSQEEAVLLAQEEAEAAALAAEAEAAALKAAADAAQGIVNINTATLEQLCTLSGIGASKAAAIIAYREENGAFSSISEITNVSGIGESVYSKIKDSICVE